MDDEGGVIIDCTFSFIYLHTEESTMPIELGALLACWSLFEIRRLIGVFKALPY